MNKLTQISFSKHIFSTSFRTSSTCVARSLTQWRRKWMWRAHFAAEGSQQNPHWQIKHKRDTPPFPMEVEPSIHSFLQEVSQSVASRMNSFKERFKTTKVYATPGVIKLGIDLLRESNWDLFPSDKDSGYVLVDVQQTSPMFQSLLGKREY